MRLKGQRVVNNKLILADSPFKPIDRVCVVWITVHDTRYYGNRWLAGPRHKVKEVLYLDLRLSAYV